MTSARLLLLVIAVLVLGVRPSCRGDQDRFDGMDEYVRAAMEHWDVPGLSIAIVKDDQVVLSRYYGVCEIGGNQKVTASTGFNIASCAKPIRAATIAMLVEEGKLSWDDVLTKHLPMIEFSDPVVTNHVTLSDLLLQRTGLQRCDMLCDRGDLKPQEILRRVRHIPMAAAFRTKLTYSNPMSVALEHVVARHSGQSWQDFAAERIFEPLKMTSTTLNADKLPPGRRALRHWRSDRGVVSRPRLRDAKGIHSTVTDMAQWLRLHLALGKYEGNQLLSRRTVREMHALHLSVPIKWQPNRNIYAANFYGSGLGWFIQDYRGHKVVQHGGSWGAVTAMMPDQNLGVVVLSNHDLETLPTLLMFDVFDAYLVGAKTAWDENKWKVWTDGPGSAYRARDEAKARLEKTRFTDAKTSLPLENFAGTYQNQLYGPLIVERKEGQLVATFGKFTAPMEHWQADYFYVRAPTELSFDWLLSFKVADQRVVSLKMQHVGWDNFERDQVFVRQED